jgi:putative holliday junction resolvase
MNDETIKTGTVLAFDFGEKRIGVASGDLGFGLANPLTTLHAISNAERLVALSKLVAEWQPSLFVIGMPQFTHDDRPHPLQPHVKRFGNRLTENFKKPVHYVDERYTSLEAASMTDKGSTRRSPKDGHLDAMAACIILQSYFDSRTTPSLATS